MNLSNDIPTKLRVPAQLALDAKSVVTTLSQLQTLGTNNNLAYTYYKGMTVLCSENLNVYKWRPAEVGETGGTLASNFTYPAGIISEDGVDYSNVAYNFFKNTAITLETLSNFIQIRNIGAGIEVYKDSVLIGNTRYYNFRSLSSDSLDIRESLDGNTIYINSINSNIGISSLLANQDFTPNYDIFFEYYQNTYLPAGGTPLTTGDPFSYKGEGTFAKPFTDTRIFIFGQPATAPTIVPQTSIVNLLEAYVGTGSRLAPENLGQILKILYSVNTYYYPNDFNYSGLNLKIEGNMLCSTTGYLVDMDNPLYFKTDSDICRISIAEDLVVNCTESLGLRNSGNSITSPSPFTTGKAIIMEDPGLLYFTYNGPDVLSRYIFTGNGNVNDSQGHFDIRCVVRADHQGIYKCENNTRITFYNQIQSGTYLGSVNLNLKAFHMTGGLVRFFEKGAISINSEGSGRNYGVTFEPSGIGLGGNCNFGLNSAVVTGNSNYCFMRLNDNPVGFTAFNSSSGHGFSTTLPGDTVPVNGLFGNLGATKWNVDMKNCVFPYTGIDFDKVDLTSGNNISSVNYIGNLIIETLVKHPYRRDGGSNTLGNLFLPKYSKFINMNGSMVESDWYVDVML